ncbi:MULTISPECIES: LLM class flavin-dependent oxidoreductase [unclassified Mycobacterium]|uniref:LLM class flavin-dependent oxidoreductase n=1 Tax=unclassified Mycobacterium TaxID=2642494 RepID=UPI0029C688E5|nr:MULTISPECIES: LLM class flavin-dependent oxidoreductase [unclassified Mycobacterium]
MHTPSASVLGLLLPPVSSFDVLREALGVMDATGFDSVWVPDRTLAGIGPWPELWTQLGSVAAITRRLTVGTAVVVPSRRHPLHVAHALASADLTTGGRLIAGVGLGGLDPREHQAVGVDVRERAGLTDEYVGLLRRLWRDDAVDFDDARISLRGAAIPVRPTRPIPIWIGGGSDAAIKRAARIGDGWLGAQQGPENYRQSVERLAECAREHDRSPEQVPAGIYLFGAIDQNRERAAAKLQPAMTAMFGAPLEVLSEACLWGTPSDWCQRIADYQQAGATKVVVALFTTELIADVQLLAEEVLPALPTPPT